MAMQYLKWYDTRIMFEQDIGVIMQDELFKFN